MTTEKKVYGFKTKNKIGFTNSEIIELLKQFDGLNIERFNNALNRITVMKIDDEIVIYRIDVLHAINSAINALYRFNKD